MVLKKRARMFVDFFGLALKSFNYRPTRTLLTMIGIFIGIAAVVALFSLGTGFENAVSGQFQALGGDKVFIMGGSSFASSAFGGTSGGGLFEKDLQTIKRTSGVDKAAGMGFKGTLVSFQGESKSSMVLGIPTDAEGKAVFESLSSYQVTEGKWPLHEDKFGAVVGYLVAHDTVLFEKKVALGDKIDVGGKSFKVMGVIEQVGNRYDDTQIYIPLETMQEVFDAKDYYSLFAQVEKGRDTEKVAEEIKRKLRDQRGLKEGEEDFSVQTPKQIQESFATILSVVQAIVIAISSISLLVGAIGIMNTMYTAVLERTRDIGIMKAVGARNGDIALMFVIESGILGLVGGAIGAGLGIALSLLAEAGAHAAGVYILKIVVSPDLVVGVLLFSFVLGTLSGLFPSMQAARLKPVEALRYE